MNRKIFIIIIFLFALVRFGLPACLCASTIESPFGASGALSRPFIEDDNIHSDEVYRRIAALEKPYLHVQDIAVKWIRPGIDIDWSIVQPSTEDVKEGEFYWTVLDSVYGTVPLGINILGTINIGNFGSGRGIKPGTWEFVSPQAEKDYIKFVKTVVRRYKGLVNYWQTQNEPVFITVREDIERGNINLDYSGFSHIQEITYNAIKEVDPLAKVALGGLAGGHVFDMQMHVLKNELEGFFIPLLIRLKGKYVDIFDIHFYGEYEQDWLHDWKKEKVIYDIIRRELDRNGFNNTEIWITEIAVPSVPYGEREQAIALVKRFIYPLSFGVKKIFWWNMIEGEYPLLALRPSNNHGLVYDGLGENDPGYAVKKLSYYTYKKMVEILDGSDLSDVQAIQELDNIYIYRFRKNSKVILVAWNESAGPKQVDISGFASTTTLARITESVPRYGTGKGVVDYNSVFRVTESKIKLGRLGILLSDIPVFIEEE